MKLEPNNRYLIVHADDGGMCHSVNQAIITALESEIVTSTSLMVPCPQFEEIADFLLQNSQYDVGVHLTLTCEYPHYPWSPISDKEKVPSLINPNGFFWHSVDEFTTHATPEDVETELRAQIERFLDFGIQPTHLDTHQGTVFKDLRFLEKYVKLGLEYKIPTMLIKPNEHTFKLINRRGLNLDITVIEKLMELGLPFLDFLFMIDNSTKTIEERENLYVNMIEQLPIGITQIIIHPGFNDQELKKITSNSIYRFYDFSIFTNSKTKQLIDKHKIKPISWKEIKSLFQV